MVSFGRKKERLSDMEVEELIRGYLDICRYVGAEGPNREQDDEMTRIIMELSGTPGVLNKLQLEIEKERFRREEK